MRNEERNERLPPDRKRAEASGRVPGIQAGRHAWLKRIAIYAVVLIAVFLIGFLPMWLRSRERGRERDSARRELRVSRMANMLSAAVIDARRGDYEPARQSASDFFTTLSTEVNSDSSALDRAQRENVRPSLAQRDEVITLLARSDPASADRLAELYVSYRKAMGNATALNTVR